MSRSKRASLDNALDPREPNPFTIKVTNNTHANSRQATVIDDNTTTPTPSRSPSRPVAHASSSGSLTDTLTKHGRKISTTISRGDVKKWMETGTYGEEAPDDQEKGVEEHVVYMMKEDVEAGQALDTNTKTEDDVSKTEKKQKETDEEFDEAEAEGESVMAESIVVGMLVDRETQMADSTVPGMRCDWCGGLVIWAKTRDYLTVCQKCREPQ